MAVGVGVAVAGGYRHVPMPQSTPSLRFLSPLIERSVPISGVTLADWLHGQRTHDGKSPMSRYWIASPASSQELRHVNSQ